MKLNISRLAVRIYHGSEDYLLGILACLVSTIEFQSVTIMKILYLYSLKENIHWLVFDTTESNTGKLK